MDVKEINLSSSSQVTGGKQRSLKALPRVAPNSEAPKRAEGQGDPVSVDLSSRSASKSQTALVQTKTAATNVSETANSINAYLTSLGGILEQGLKETSQVRRTALSKEANEVLQVVRERAVQLKAPDSSGVSSDPLRSEVEQKIGRTLELLFPESPQEGSALPELSSSNKELIIAVQTKILRASQYISSLRASDLKKDADVQALIDKAETAQINAESSQTSLRDIDSAFDLVKETTKAIGNDTKTALFAVGALRDQVDVQG